MTLRKNTNWLLESASVGRPDGVIHVEPMRRDG